MSIKPSNMDAEHVECSDIVRHFADILTTNIWL